MLLYDGRRKNEKKNTDAAHATSVRMIQMNYLFQKKPPCGTKLEFRTLEIHSYLRISNEDLLADSRSSRKSMELLLLWSKEALIELDELLRLCLLASFGSTGVSPALLAKRLRISVSDTTPISRPLRCAPGIEPALIVGGPERGKADGGLGLAKDGGGTATA